MGLNYWVGKTASSLLETALVHRWPVISTRFPAGHVAGQDLRRLSATRPIKVAFDIGANIGQTAESFSQWFPEAQIHSFEPIRANFEQLQTRAARLPRVTAHHLACGEKTAVQMMRYGVHHHLHSLAEADAKLSADEGEAVQVTTMDDFCTKNGIESIDLLKTDTEGHDLEVLNGARALLERGGIRFVLVEAGFNDQKGQTPFCELQARLRANGFVLSGFYDLMRGGERKEILWFGNALFTHETAVR